MKMNWSTAEEFCLSKGGHLASVTWPLHWQKLEFFTAGNEIDKESIWLGGTDEAKEGVWIWTDGRKWKEEHWYGIRRGSDFNCLYSH